MTDPVVRLKLRDNNLHDPCLMPVGTNVNALAVDTVTNLARQEHDDEGIDLPALDEFGCWIDEVDRLVVTLTSVIDAPDVEQHRKSSATLRLFKVLGWQPDWNARILGIRARHRYCAHLTVGMGVGLTDRNIFDLGASDRD